MKVIVTVPATTVVLDKPAAALGKPVAYFSHSRKGPQVRVPIQTESGYALSTLKGRYLFGEDGKAKKDMIEWYQPQDNSIAPLEIAILSRLTHKLYPRKTLVTFDPPIAVTGELPRAVSASGQPILWEGETAGDAGVPAEAVCYFPPGSPNAPETVAAAWATAAAQMEAGEHDPEALAALADESDEGDDA